MKNQPTKACCACCMIGLLLYGQYHGAHTDHELLIRHNAPLLEWRNVPVASSTAYQHWYDDRFTRS
jgi:hypothetical protein